MYQFVNIAYNGEVKPSDAQRRGIRRQAMSVVSRERAVRRKQKMTKNGRFPLEIDPSLLPVPGSPQHRGTEAHLEDQLEQARRTLDDPTWLVEPGAGSRDPFTPYPVPMTERMHETLDLLYRSSHPRFTTFRKLWFPLGLADAAAFHQILSNACIVLSRTRPHSSLLEDAIAQQNIAIRRIEKDIREFRKQAAPSLITGILALAAGGNIRGEHHSFQLHCDAIERIILLAGGISQVQLAPQARLLLFVVETNGAARGDTIPRFPLPHELLFQIQVAGAFEDGAPSDETLPRSSHFLSVCGERDESLMQALAELRSIGEAVTEGLARLGAAFWSDAELVGFRVTVLLHKLLSLQTETAVPSSQPVNHAREATRLAAIISLAGFRRQLHSHQSFNSTHVSKLRELLSEQGAKIVAERQSRAPLVLWQLYMGGMESSKAADKEWFVKCAREMAAKLQIKSWGAVRSVLQDTFWIEEVYSISGQAVWDAIRGIPSTSI